MLWYCFQYFRALCKKYKEKYKEKVKNKNPAKQLLESLEVFFTSLYLAIWNFSHSSAKSAMQTFIDLVRFLHQSRLKKTKTKTESVCSVKNIQTFIDSIALGFLLVDGRGTEHCKCNNIPSTCWKWGKFEWQFEECTVVLLPINIVYMFRFVSHCMYSNNDDISGEHSKSFRTRVV